MESSRCSALFMTALFSLYPLKIVLARGSFDIFPTHSYDRSSGDIVLEPFLCSLLTSTTALSRFWRYST